MRNLITFTLLWLGRDKNTYTWVGFKGALRLDMTIVTFSTAGRVQVLQLTLPQACDVLGTAENHCGVAHPVRNDGLDLTSCGLSARRALMLTHRPRSRPSRVQSGGTCVSPSSGWWGGWRPLPGTANSRCLRRSPTGPGRKQQTRCSATSAPSCHIGSCHSLNSRVGAPPAERRAGREKEDRQVNHKRLDEKKNPQPLETRSCIPAGGKLEALEEKNTLSKLSWMFSCSGMLLVHAGCKMKDKKN